MLWVGPMIKHRRIQRTVILGTRTGAMLSLDWTDLDGCPRPGSSPLYSGLSDVGVGSAPRMGAVPNRSLVCDVEETPKWAAVGVLEIVVRGAVSSGRDL